MPESNRDNLSFRGGSVTDCEDFISAVNRWAFDEHKDEDDRLVARFAYSRMSGVVMRLYDTLDLEVQGSWRLLRQALLAQYPLPDPTIPASPLVVSSASRDNLCVGIIRVEVDGDQTIRYLVHSDVDHTTRGEVTDKDSATLFKFRRSGELQPIRLAKHGAWFGLRWKVLQARRAVIPDAWACFECVTEATNAAGCRRQILNGPASWVIWKYEQTTGLLEVSWHEDNGFHITETHPQIGFNRDDRFIYLFKDAEKFSREAGYLRIKTRLIFVPL